MFAEVEAGWDLCEQLLSQLSVKGQKINGFIREGVGDTHWFISNAMGTNVT